MKVSVIGSGISGLLTALSFLEAGEDVDLYGEEVTEKNRPLVLLEPAVLYLRKYLPDIYRKITNQGARELSVAQLIAERFPGAEAFPEEKSPFLCLSSLLLLNTLRSEIQGRPRLRTFTGQWPDLNILEKNSDLILDTSGLKSPYLNKSLLEHKGHALTVLTKFYELKNEGSGFNLISRKGIKGGVYPQENSLFALSYHIHGEVTEPDKTFQEWIEQTPGAGNVIARAEAKSELFRRTLPQSHYSHYYQSLQSETRYFPVGETFISCAPAYGRNISFFCWMMETLLITRNDSWEVRKTALKKSARLSKTFWTYAVQSEAEYLLPRLHYEFWLAPLLDQDTSYYRDFLLHYQLRTAPWALVSPHAHLKGLKARLLSLNKFRIAEILQVFFICLSGLVFASDLKTQSLPLWAGSLLTHIASAFWLNDYFDFEADRLNRRKSVFTDPRFLLFVSLMFQLASMVMAAFYSQLLFKIIVLSNCVSWIYSSPLLHLKRRVWWPFISHFCMGGLYFLSGGLHDHVDLPQVIRTDLLKGTFFWGLVLSTGSIVNELVDEKNDSFFEIPTIANRWPQISWYLLAGCHVMALIVLTSLAIDHHLTYTSILGLAVPPLYLYCFHSKNPAHPDGFRQIVRMIFISFILIFAVEMAIVLW